MRAGALRYPVSLYSITKVKNDAGQPIRTRTLYKQTRTDRKFLSGTEGTVVSQITAIPTVLFKMRYESGINEQMEILFEGDWYNIIFINYPNKHLAIELTCTKLKE